MESCECLFADEESGPNEGYILYAMGYGLTSHTNLLQLEEADPDGGLLGVQGSVSAQQ
jgi:hypothetical protein